MKEGGEDIPPEGKCELPTNRRTTCEATERRPGYTYGLAHREGLRAVREWGKAGIERPPRPDSVRTLATVLPTHLGRRRRPSTEAAGQLTSLESLTLLCL